MENLEWVDKRNDVDDVNAEDINLIAHYARELNKNKADKVSIPRNLGDLIDNITQQNYDANSSSPQSGKAVALAIKSKADAKTEKGGFIGGIEAVTASGGAIGYKAKSHLGGAVGYYAQTGSGGAVGGSAKSGDGGAVGTNTQTEDGGAVGCDAKSGNGGAVGIATQTSNGGSIGYSAKSGNGFSGGFCARASTDSNGNYIDAIQLGEGTNYNPKTLQIYDTTLMNADGTIPEERLTKAKDYIDEKIGDIETALDTIIAMQNELTGGGEV